MKYLGLRRTRELCEIYGPNRMMFGSDFPMWSPASGYRIFRSLGFSEDAYERMCWHNAERWLQTDIA
jgi:predicted TIM-barrel fold metal-dependent hydrolase